MKQYDDSRDAIFQELYSIALDDKNVIVLAADTGAAMFKEFKKNIPEQFYNVGVSEQNIISASAGLALAGKKVFLFGISNFVTLRCYDQIKVDICAMKLPVTIIGMGTGYIYSEDGPTHHMTEDISIMRSLPKMTIWNISDYTMAGSLVHLAYKDKYPNYLRFDKGPFIHKYDQENPDFSDGLTTLKKGDIKGNEITIISTGIMVDQALKIAEELEKDEIHTCVVDLYRLKPVNKKLLIKSIENSNRVVTLEEHSIFGGIGSIVCETLAQEDILIPLKIIGIPDTYRSEVGNREMLRSLDKIDIFSVITTIKEWINNNRSKM